jgi:hypothetical protein
MKKMLAMLSIVWLGSWLVAQTLDSGDLAQAVQRTITLGAGLEQWQDLPQYPITLSNAAEPAPVTATGYYSVAWDEANLYVLGVFNQPQETVLASLPTDAPEWIALCHEPKRHTVFGLYQFDKLSSCRTGRRNALATRGRTSAQRCFACCQRG